MKRLLPSLSLLATGALLIGCGNAGDGDSSSDSRSESEAGEPSSVVEQRAPQPRLAVSYDGGVQVLDATSGEVVADEAIEGYARINPAGDDRHVVVSGNGGFSLLDVGAWTAAHGDHSHSWTADPRFGDLLMSADEPGHVVPHHGVTTLFDDASGAIASFATGDLSGSGADLVDLELDESSAGEAHHGVAVTLEDGSVIHTEGTVDERATVTLLDADGEEVASTDACPGVHGEAFVGEVAAFGCEDGVVLVDGDEVTKVSSPDAYGRIGNQAGHESSPFLLGDYKTDADAELERPTRVAAVDTRDASLRLVDLGTSYTFRSLGRTPDGDGLVLGTDGALHVVDLAAGEVSASTSVLDRWREPTDWQQPRPTLEVAGETAYVTDPEARQIHVVDLTRMKVTDTLELDVAPDEVVAVTG